jgi:hypothetical protein
MGSLSRERLAETPDSEKAFVPVKRIGYKISVSIPRCFKRFLGSSRR